MIEINPMYLVGRAKIYRDEAQRGIELETQGDPERAQLVWKSLKRSCEAELSSYHRKDDDYFEFLNQVATFLRKNPEILAGLELVRLSSREYLKKTTNQS